MFYAELAAQARIVHVVGTTGLSPDDLAKLKAAAFHARIVQSGNMSLGVNLLAGLVRKVAATSATSSTSRSWRCTHRHKVDAPSGTALLLGEAAAEGRGVALSQRKVAVRDGHTGPREPGTIGFFATLRGGSVVGEHSVIFAGAGEASNSPIWRATAASSPPGAVKAALWAQSREPGFYGMDDVLGL